MKTRIPFSFVFSIFVSSTVIVLADADFYTTSTNLWNQGHKHEVYTNALERLNVDTNDIAGLLLSLEYDIAFMRLDTISNSASRVLMQGESLTNEHFLVEYPGLKENIDSILLFLANHPISENERVQEAEKGNITGKRMMFEIVLEALQKDNLIPELQ